MSTDDIFSTLRDFKDILRTREQQLSAEATDLATRASVVHEVISLFEGVLEKLERRATTEAPPCR